MRLRPVLLSAALLALVGFAGAYQTGYLAQIAKMLSPTGPGGVRPWPPVNGEPFPNLELAKLSGARLRMEDLRGKVALVELVATRGPLSQASVGARRAGAFKEGAVDGVALETRAELSARGVDLHHPDLVHVYAVVLSEPRSLVEPAEAHEWAQHFRLESVSQVAVARGGAEWVREDVFARTPSLWLVDREGRCVMGALGPAPSSDLRADLAPKLVDMLGGHSGRDVPRAPPGAPLEDDAGRITAALLARDFGAADRAAKAAQDGGRVEGDWRARIELALDGVLGDARAEALLDAWAINAPESPWAHLFRGELRLRKAERMLGGRPLKELAKDDTALYLEHVVDAREDLVRACDLDRTIALAGACLVTCSIALDTDPRIVRGYLERSLDMDPLSVAARARFLLRIETRRQGGLDAAVEFVRRALDEEPYESAMKHLVLLKHELLSRPGGKLDRAYLRRPEVREEIAAASEALLADYPRAFATIDTLARLYSDAGDVAAGQRLRERSAAAGCARDMRVLAEQALRGLGGAEPDHARAFRLYRAAAERGDAAAMTAIGKAFEEGAGLPLDRAAGEAWIRAGAERGDLEARKLLRERAGGS